MEASMNREQDESPDRNPDDGSDADSDLEELQGDIAKFDESVREFLASHHGSADTPRAARGGFRGRGARGPRKAAKPRGDITARLSKVNQAFLGGDYDQALDLAFEVIRINAETHQAWTALASIFRERGELNRALSAMVYAAHLRPKDVSGWHRCASFALDTIEDDEGGNLHTARLCYSAALRADPTNLEARLGKAAVCHRQGHLPAAISEYKTILRRRPYDLELVRKLAEACVDTKNAATTVPSAIQAYRQFFESETMTQSQHDRDALWHDVGIYVELFASIGRYHEGIRELKALSRWLVGRVSEQYWDDWQTDDREWDANDERRSSVSNFDAANSNPLLYGNALPQDLRIRLAIYRLRLGHESEAVKHLCWLGSDDSHTRDFVNDFPFLAYELATELARCGRQSLAVRYYEVLRALPGEPDPATLLQLGRCYLALGEQPVAEECFLGAIDADEDSIDARIELANMYEKAREDEEALILAAEAMALREAQDQPSTGGPSVEGSLAAAQPVESDRGPTQRRKPRVRANDKAAKPRDGPKKPVIPRRYRPKRLAGADKRLQDEQARAVKLSHQYEAVRDLKRQILAGRSDLIPAWMATSKDLVDDFRSLKRFYTWDKYLHFLGSKGPLQHPGAEQQDSELSQMYERLSRSIAPQADHHAREPGIPGLNAHQGISFEDWLDLFLDYAIGLAIAHRRNEAYQICQAAKDSTVFQSSEHDFVIYVAWSVCAIYTNDEERCVATARHLMRDGAISDSYRMFALLSRLCQSPVSWYTSGPAQKFILRQIKAIDASHVSAPMQRWDHEVERKGAATSSPGVNVDVCLLMVYGHILFTSTSYAYSLGYFLRARSLDPTNPMINLSLGLAYAHYGLKRQSTNRQYLLLQGQAFLAQYLQSGQNGTGGSMAERLYNVGRLFQLLGTSYLSSRYYTQALEACKREGGNKDLSSCILMNSIVSLMSVKNNSMAFSLLKSNLRL
ncbi:Transcription factor tau subunit sfc4 [Tolypocladium paradoxum]|uniref:Transcription factor tau subunit sfc4 n=1 Tax=Tolypocladium paradoxum TaxID=94208 RepID=A0A2S4L7Q4_9HYPO|nr:Transcription factor tau subunit sfc4 [Tolypocladium paradoxum]